MSTTFIEKYSVKFTTKNYRKSSLISLLFEGHEIAA